MKLVIAKPKQSNIAAMFWVYHIISNSWRYILGQLQSEQLDAELMTESVEILLVHFHRHRYIFREIVERASELIPEEIKQVAVFKTYPACSHYCTQCFRGGIYFRMLCFSSEWKLGGFHSVDLSRRPVKYYFLTCVINRPGLPQDGNVCFTSTARNLLNPNHNVCKVTLPYSVMSLKTVISC